MAAIPGRRKLPLSTAERGWSVGTDEQLLLGVDSFQDVEQFETLVVQIDADPAVIRLYQQIQEVLDLRKVIRRGTREVE